MPVRARILSYQLSPNQHINESNIACLMSAGEYRQCTGHWKCGKGSFCGTNCWTGNCKNGVIAAGTRGDFCQPCNQCVDKKDSISGSCDICPPVVIGARVGIWSIRVGRW